MCRAGRHLREGLFGAVLSGAQNRRGVLSVWGRCPKWLWTALRAFLILSCLVGPEAAEARLEFSQPGMFVNARTEPEAIFADMRLAESPVCGAPMHKEGSASPDDGVIGNKSLLDICLERTIHVREDRRIALARDNIGAGICCGATERPGALLLCGFLGRERQCDTGPGRVEHVNGGFLSAVFKDDKDAKRFARLQRTVECRIDGAEPCSILECQGAIGFHESYELQEHYCDQQKGKLVGRIKTAKPLERPIYVAQGGDYFPCAYPEENCSEEKPSVKASNFFTYNGREFNENDVQRGAFIILGIICVCYFANKASKGNL